MARTATLSFSPALFGSSSWSFSYLDIAAVSVAISVTSANAANLVLEIMIASQ
jgi:hypothetical protein